MSDRLEILAEAEFRGPSILAPHPVIALRARFHDPERATLDRVERRLGALIRTAAADLGARRRCEFPPFETDALSGAARSGGLGLIAALAVRLQNLIGHDLSVWTIEPQSDEAVAIAAFQYRNRLVGQRAGAVASRIVSRLIDSEELEDAALNTEIEDFIDAAMDDDLPAMAARLVLEAEARGIPWRRLTQKTRIVELGYGHKRRRFRGSYTENTSYVATMLATNKALAAKILREMGAPAPINETVRSAVQAVAAAKRIGFPVVVKPNTKDFGTGIYTDLRDTEAVRRAYEAVSPYGQVLVEENIPGNQHRLMVTHGELSFASEHRPAGVIGDGQHSVAELVEIENRDRGEIFTYDFFKKITIDDQAIGVLATQGYNLRSIPPAGTQVRLRSQANLSYGGTGERATDRLHPENKAMAERVVRLIGLDVAGIDFVTTDISRPYYETGGAICDINPTPGFIESDRREDTKRLLAPFFPDGDDGRIPIVSIVSDEGSTELASFVVRFLQAEGHRVGHAGAQGATIDGILVGQGDHSGLPGCRSLLHDPAVTALVLETSLMRAAQEGLGYDHCAVTVLCDARNVERAQLPAPRKRVVALLAAVTRSMVVTGVADPDLGTLTPAATSSQTCVIADENEEPDLPPSVLAVVCRAPDRLVLPGDSGGGAVRCLFASGPMATTGSLRALGFAAAVALGLGLDPQRLIETAGRNSRQP